MTKSIERELTAIRNKYNEMAEEYQELKTFADGKREETRKEEIEGFFEKLNEIRCDFKYEGLERVWSIHYDDYVVIAISKDKAEKVI